MFILKSVIVMVVVVTVSPQLTNRYLYPHEELVASQSQIKFAEENKYDETGPSSKKYKGAYKTYKTLEEVLIGYLDDPDTKLPESERIKAYYHYIPKIPHSIKRTELYQKEKPGVSNKYYIEHVTDSSIDQFEDINAYRPEKLALPKYKAAKEESKNYRPFRPIALNWIDRPISVDSKPDESERRPEYTFSYGVHDRSTGDSKSMHETRSGDSVKGYYTLVDPDGQQRTVQYSADDHNGFRALVQRTPTNSHPY